MAIDKILAHLSCTNLEDTEKWFAKLFGKDPDARPMDGLVEWHDHRSAGFQLFRDRGAAGHGTMTLFVSDIEDEHARLEHAGLAPPDIQSADSKRVLQLRDPDRNLIVLVQMN